MNNPLADHPQRLEALHPERSFIVQAPAGSGKTGLLVRRFLVLLGGINNPEEILAITFTRKATAEMRSRILLALSGAMDAKIAEKLEPDLLELAKTALARDQKLQWQILENPGRLKIQTIDSLCHELVRNMPWSARFGAAPGVLEDKAANGLYLEAAKRTLDHLEHNRATSSHCANLFLLVNADFHKAQRLLAIMLKKRDHWMRGLHARSRSEFEQMWCQVTDKELEIISDRIPENMKANMVELANYAGENLVEDNPNHALCQCIDMDHFPTAEASFLPQWRGLAALLLTEQHTLRKQVNVKQGFPKEDKQRKLNIKNVLDKFAQLPELVAGLCRIPLLADGHFSDKQWQALKSLLHLLPIAAAELRLLFKENNQADYIEITQRSELALGPDDAPSDLALSMDHQINHILMDEVQDTSRAQIELLTKLTRGWQGDDGRTLFFVGDPMQSIYRFREADVANFLYIQNNGIGDIRPEPLVLNSNFRSDPQLVNWFNTIFPQVFPTENNALHAAVSYSPSAAIRSQKSGDGVQIHGRLADDDSNEFDSICDEIQTELNSSSDSTIGILGRSRSHLTGIAERLRNQKIPFQAIELESLANRSAIQDLVSLTRGLIQPSDRVAWLSILRAPWCGLKLADITLLAANDFSSSILELARDKSIVDSISVDGRQRLNNLITQIELPLAQRGRVSLRHNVQSAWLNLSGPSCIDYEDLADCESYLNLLEWLEQEYPQITKQLLNDTVLSLWSNSHTHSRVQLLTIHKSKGLEFDLVFLPQLHRRSGRPEQLLLQWARLPEQLLVAPLAHSDEKADGFNNYLKNIEKLRQDNENRRLLYVACTRARQKLHIHYNVAVDKNGEIRPPISGSLLHLLWPGLKDEIYQNLESPKTTTPPDENSELATFMRLPGDWRPLPIPKGLQSSHAINLAQPQQPDPIEFSWAGETARIAGIAIHKILQRIHGKDWSAWKIEDDSELIASCKPVLIENGLSRENLGGAVTIIEDAISNIKQDSKADWIFSSDHQEVRCEWSLTGLVDGSLSNIIIDRSFIDQSGIRWIIDFKSSRHEGSDINWFLDNEKTRYQNQMNGYAKILGQLEQNKIKLGLYFPLLKGWCEWSA